MISEEAEPPAGLPRDVSDVRRAVELCIDDVRFIALKKGLQTLRLS
jgi:hypothetical protein